MLNQTRRALEDFDNQHEFERMAADVLNALGYSSVEPMAPAGGADGGRDVQFREGDSLGIAFVTLDKKIRDKFKRDLANQKAGEGRLALFCNVDVSPSMKVSFARDAIDLGYTLDVFDLERLRSLLDSSLKDIRRRYLGIDDAVAARLRADVNKLLRFPDAFPDEAPSVGLMEGMFSNQLPRRLFDLLMSHDERDVLEVPGIGEALHNHMTAYYRFRQEASHLENELMAKIGTLWKPSLAQALRIHLRYSVMRFAGHSSEEISAGIHFLNYGITWENAEKMFVKLSEDAPVGSLMSKLFQSHKELVGGLKALIARPSAIIAVQQ